MLRLITISMLLLHSADSFAGDLTVLNELNFVQPGKDLFTAKLGKGQSGELIVDATYDFKFGDSRVLETSFVSPDFLKGELRPVESLFKKLGLPEKEQVASLWDGQASPSLIGYVGKGNSVYVFGGLKENKIAESFIIRGDRGINIQLARRQSNGSTYFVGSQAGGIWIFFFDQNNTRVWEKYYEGKGLLIQDAIIKGQNLYVVVNENRTSSVPQEGCSISVLVVKSDGSISKSHSIDGTFGSLALRNGSTSLVFQRPVKEAQELFIATFVDFDQPPDIASLGVYRMAISPFRCLEIGEGSLLIAGTGSAVTKNSKPLTILVLNKDNKIIADLGSQLSLFYSRAFGIISKDGNHYIAACVVNQDEKVDVNYTLGLITIGEKK